MPQTSYSSNMAKGFAGMLADGSRADIITMRNVEASAEIAFGLAVKYGGTSDDLGAKLPAAETDKIAGIVVHTHSYNKTNQLGTTGVKTGELLNVIRKGRILVTAQTAVAPGDRLWVRAVAGGAEVLGGLEDADDSTDMIDCTNQGVWMTTAAAGELAWLEVDFTNDAT